MGQCNHCSFLPKLEDQGKLLLYVKNGDIPSGLIDQLKGLYELEEDGPLKKITYFSFNQLENVIDIISQHIDVKSTHLLGSWNNIVEDDGNYIFPSMTPFPELAERIRNRKYLSVINEKKFTQHIQPIVNLQTEEHIFGYEFLTRPISNDFHFFPGDLFAFSQKAGLQTLLDSQARMTAIEISAKLLPKGVKRFINFLPSSIYDPHHCLKSTFQAVEKSNTDANDLVFEVVETEKIHNIDHLKTIFTVYQQHGIKVALDDLGAGYSTLDVLKKLRPNFAKIDRHIIDYCDESEEKQKQLMEVQQLASDYGITLLAEGIERKEELQLCKEIGIELAQGYYIGKPASDPLNV